MGILKIAFIGCGNFGGQVANAAVKRGFPCVAANASTRDFAMLDDSIEQFLIGDGKGTGKSRDTAKEFLISHVNIMKDETLTKIILDNDVIIIGASAGGGFGSGSAPTMVDILRQIYPDKCFRIVTTLPSESETYEAQKHTEEFMKEILELGIPYIVYDNNNYRDLEATDMSEAIISAIVRDMEILRGDYILPTVVGGIDERDLLTVNSTPGRTVCSMITDLDESMIEKDGIVAALKKQIQTSANAAVVDDKGIDASAMMYNLVGPDLKKYGAAVIQDIQTTFGSHIGDFRNESVDQDEMPAFAACILAGLTPPTTRIDRVITRRQTLEKEINERQRASTKLNNVNAGNLSLSTKSFGAGDKVNVDDILRKFTSSSN